MAVVMVSLNSTKSGEFVARKVIPKDAREEYKRLFGVSTGSHPQGRCGHAESSRQSAARPMAGASRDADPTHSSGGKTRRAAAHETRRRSRGHSVTLQSPANGISENTHEIPLKLPCVDRLGPPRFAWAARLMGASVVAVSRGRCRRIGVLGAHRWSWEWPEATRRRACDWSLSGGKRTSRSHLATVATDPNRTWQDQERRIVALNRPLECVGCSSELCLIMAAARTAIPCCIRARTFPEEPCILQGIRDEMAVSPSEALPALRRMNRARQAR
jgi:hypothetical protein